MKAASDKYVHTFIHMTMSHATIAILGTYFILAGFRYKLRSYVCRTNYAHIAIHMHVTI